MCLSPFFFPIYGFRTEDLSTWSRKQVGLWMSLLETLMPDQPWPLHWTKFPLLSTGSLIFFLPESNLGHAILCCSCSSFVLHLFLCVPGSHCRGCVGQLLLFIMVHPSPGLQGRVKPQSPGIVLSQSSMGPILRGGLSTIHTALWPLLQLGACQENNMPASMAAHSLQGALQPNIDNAPQYLAQPCNSKAYNCGVGAQVVFDSGKPVFKVQFCSLYRLMQMPGGSRHHQVKRCIHPWTCSTITQPFDPHQAS